MKKFNYYGLLLVVCAIVQWMACNKENSVPIADLPPEIKAYVDANYPGYTLDEAEQETDCAGTSVYEVEIEQGEENELELCFDTAGNFLYAETEITMADLPTAVVNSIADHYAGFKTEEPNKFTMADGTIRYEVELEKDKTDKDVLFDSEGGVICEQDEQ